MGGQDTSPSSPSSSRLRKNFRRVASNSQVVHRVDVVVEVEVVVMGGMKMVVVVACHGGC